MLSQSYPREQLSFSIPRQAIGAVEGELRIFLRSSDGEPVAFANLGGFSAPPIVLPRELENVDVTIEAAGLAEGRYQSAVEFVDAETERLVFKAETEVFDFFPLRKAGEFNNMLQSHRAGFFRLAMMIDGVSKPEFRSEPIHECE